MAKIFGEIDAKNILTLDKSFARSEGQPLDTTEIYYSYADAESYAKTDVAYVGQKITVIENDVITHYSIEDTDGTLKELGSGVGQAIENGGEIFNDYESNQALSEFSHAEGMGTTAGARAFSLPLEYAYTTSDGQDGAEGWYYLGSVEGILTALTNAVNAGKKLLYTVVLDSNFDLNGEVLDVDEANKKIKVSNYKLPLSSGSTKIDEDSYLFLVTETTSGTKKTYQYVELGDKFIGEHAHAEGRKTKAISIDTHAEGRETLALGKYAHAEGRETVAIYGAHAEGKSSQALGETSHAEGLSTKALGNNSHTEGGNTLAEGDYSHAEGSNTEAKGNYSHAQGLNTKAIGPSSHAEGVSTTASGEVSHAEGESSQSTGKASHAEGGSTAGGNYSHAEGLSTVASATSAHAEGFATEALKDASHTEGIQTKANGQASHAEGNATEALGSASHAEGYGTKALGNNSHAEGESNQATGQASHVEGKGTEATQSAAHAEGDSSKATAYFAHAEGKATEASGSASHAEGFKTIASNDASHAEGRETKATGAYSHSEGEGTVAGSPRSHAEGLNTIAGNAGAHAEGQNTYGGGLDSHAEGKYTATMGEGAHAEGVATRTIRPENIEEEVSSWEGGKKDFSLAFGKATHVEGVDNLAKGIAAHAEGYQTYAKGNYSHAEGDRTIASGNRSHAEGLQATSSGAASHAEGQSTLAQGVASHAGGYGSHAQADYSFAHGQTVRTTQPYQTAFGTFNASNSDALFIIGNGESDSDRKNAFTVTKDGRAKVQKDPTEAMDVVTKQYADNIKDIAQEALDKVEGVQRFATMTELNAFICPNGPEAFLASSTSVKLEPNDYLVIFVSDTGASYFDMNVNAYNVLTGTEFTLNNYIERVSVGSYLYGYVCNDTGEEVIVTAMSLTYYWIEEDGYGSMVDVPHDYSTNFTTYKVVSDLSQLTEEDATRQYIELAVGTRFLVTEDPEAIYVWNGTELVREAQVKQSILNGKKITVTGDSICAGVYDDNNTTSDKYCNYSKLLRDNYGMEIMLNAAQGGATICDVKAAQGRMCIANSVSTSEFITAANNSDYIILEGGVNDSFHYNNYGITLGSLSSSYNLSNKEAGTVFYEAFEKMLYEVTTKFIGKKIGFIITHRITKNYGPTEPAETSFYEAVKKSCEKWGVPYLDLSSTCPPFQLLKSAGSIDDTVLAKYFIKEADGDQDTGWHPNKLGYETFYVPKIVSWLESL